ncbi:MAG: class I adenylate-forming enzyme family protein [Acidimicrobiales bacterium]
MTGRQTSPGSLRSAVEVLAWAADHHGGTEAYVEPATDGPGPQCSRQAMTFADWERGARGVAGLFSRLGVGRGDVVGLVLPSSIDYAVCYAAAMALGAVTSGVNPRLGPAELESITARAHPVVTVVDPMLGVTLPGSSGTVVERAEVAAALDGPGPTRVKRPEPSDPVAVVWTSGTTGRPKGAVFDHANLAAVAAGTDVLSRPGDRRLSPLPFAHVGYMTRAWDEMVHEITTVITPTPWRATDALEVMVAEGVTVAQGVPTQWALVLELDDLDRADLSALRIAGTGAARISGGQVAEMRRRLGVPVVVRYTSTESSLGTGTRPEDRDEVVATTVGRPVPGVELVVADEDGRPAPPGRIGRVRLRSGAVMRGYWGGPSRPGATGAAAVVDPEATATVLAPDGWLTTGDFGSLDAEGNLTLAGRDNELYIRGGYNVFPAEVEAVLAGHPGVARVAVVGAPDPVLGEVGVAFVVPTGGPAGVPDADSLRRLCADRLADYKAPDAVVVLDDLPLTPMMKVDKRALGDRAARAAKAAGAARAESRRARRAPNAVPSVGADGVTR